MEVKPIADIRAAIAARQFPTVVMWNRLEGRPRTHHFDRALKAEVRDALWMLTKQWQMGEFKGDDAGSPVFAKIHITSSQLNLYKADGHPVQNFENNTPLEVKIEQRNINFIRAGKDIHIDLRLQMGNYWLKLIKAKGLNYRSEYINRYKFLLPPKDRTTDYIYAHPNVWQQYAAISGRSMDGYQLYKYLKIPGNNASDTIVNTDPDKTSLDDLGVQFKSWFETIYYQPLDEKNDAWTADRLEYQFECIAQTNVSEKKLLAEEYYQGNPDWYVFDIEETKGNTDATPKTTFTDSFIPSHVEFDGMPNTRWWKFEDSKTSFGDVKPSTTDLSKLLLMEFGLIFANDWFLVPYTLPIGSLANIEGLTVRNNFGETIWIKAAEDTDAEINEWSMFKLHSAKQNNTLLLVPSAMKVHEGKPIEEIVLIRDEMSNMVWGIESTVPSLLGPGDKGGEYALRTRQYHEIIVLLNQLKTQSQFYVDMIAALPDLFNGPVNDKSDIEKIIFESISGMTNRDSLLAELVNEMEGDKQSFGEIVSALNKVNPDLQTIRQDLVTVSGTMYDQMKALLSQWLVDADPAVLNKAIQFFDSKKNNDFAAPIHYLAMTSVPENWIPFVPVHIKDDNRETQLQRASMLRIIDGDTVQPVKIKPQTSILREGLEEMPDALAYYIHEEEVTRAGVKVVQSFQRTRWMNGEVFVWLGMKKKTGRGEGSSGLAFDQINDVK